MAAPGNQKVLDSATMSDADIATQFEQNIQFGDCGSGQEQGLLAAKLALQKQPDFIQKDSTLVIAIISDEQDCSDAQQRSLPGQLLTRRRVRRTSPRCPTRAGSDR